MGNYFISGWFSARVKTEIKFPSDFPICGFTWMEGWGGGRPPASSTRSLPLVICPRCNEVTKVGWLHIITYARLQHYHQELTHLYSKRWLSHYVVPKSMHTFYNGNTVMISPTVSKPQCWLPML